MPELPEVETVRRGLARRITKAPIEAVEVLHPRAMRRDPAHAHARLVGARFRCVSRRGKYLWMPLAGEDVALVAHLGMSGQLLLPLRRERDEDHLRVRIAFRNAARELHFVDQRTFGWLAVAPLVGDGAGGAVPGLVAHVARDPLDPDFDDEEFVRRLRARRTQVKRALLDQTVISGVGNIYADEALWRCRLDWASPTEGLGAARARGLLEAVRAVFTEALVEGGTSFDDLYVQVNGESGGFAESLAAYGREGLPCPRCGASIRREAFMNRSSFRCPRCQRRSAR